MSRLLHIARSPRPLVGAEGAALLMDAPDIALAAHGVGALPSGLEARFRSETAGERTRTLVRAGLAAAAVYTALLIAEWSLTPDVFGLAAALHFGLVTPALLLIVACARPDDSVLRRDLMGAAIPMLMAAEVTVIYVASAAEGAPHDLALLAIIAILANTSLPLSSRASLWTTALCLTLMAVLARAPHEGRTLGNGGELIPISLCATLTLQTAFQRNREARRAYLLNLRHRLAMAQVGQEARHDPLTGLSNRRRLEEAAERLWAKDSPLVSPISVVLYDVDRFKAYNDLYGHQAGDDCLRRVASCALTEIGAEDDVAARYGGEEFILLLPRTPLDEARRVAERLRAGVAALRIPHRGGEELGVVTASFGVASADSRAISFADLTAEADAALYRAKRSGRNRVLASATGAPKGPKAA